MDLGLSSSRWGASTGYASWEEIFPVAVKSRAGDDDGALPPIGRSSRRFRRRQGDLRAQRWREARWIHRILRKQGRFAQLGLDKFVIKHEVGRSHFVSQFSNYVGIDPFVSNPHLLSLFAGFDLDCDGVVDPREMICAFRVLDKPDCSPLSVLQDFFLAFAFMGGTGELLVKRSNVWNMLLTPCITDEEATTVYNLAQKFQLLIGGQSRAPTPTVSRTQYTSAIQACPKLVAEMRQLFLRRLSDDERLRVLKAQAFRSIDIVEAHEFEIRLKQAAKFVFSIMLPRQKGMYFTRWVARARHFKRKRLSMAKADHFFRSQKVRAYVRYWRDWAKFPRKKRQAEAIGAVVLKKRVMYRLKRHHQSLTRLRNMRKRAVRLEFERNCRKAAKLQERVYNRWANDWKVLIFVAIRDFSLDELRIKRAARLYKRAIKRGFYARWKMFWMVRISRKKERTQKREAQRAIDEADERAAEAARKAAEEAARLKAIEDAKKEARWQEKMEQARYRLKQKEIVAWQKERRAERRAKEKVQREERLQSMFAALRAKIEGKARDMAMQYLKSKDGQVWIKMEKYPAFVLAVGEREDLTEADRKAQEGKRWHLLYDWREVSRCYEDTETGERIWPRTNKAHPKNERMSVANAEKIVTGNYLQQKIALVQKQIEKRCEEIREAEHREWQVRLIQRTYKSHKVMKALRKGIREMVTKKRAREVKRNKKRRNDAAKVLQATFKRHFAVNRARHALAQLVLQMYINKTDPETGDTIWINLATRAVSYTEPALMRSMLTGGKAKLPDDEWSYEPGATGGGVYTDLRTGEKQPEPPFGYHMCVECMTQFAVKHCVKCDDRYCSDCFRMRHNKGRRRDHEWKPVAVARIKCHWCEKKPAEVMCEECGDTNYCEPCALHVHDMDEYKGHNITPM